VQSEDRTIYLALLRQLRGMHASASNGLMRSRSKNEASPVRMPGYYSFFCIHDKHKWNACRNCKRTQSDGNAQREEYLTKLEKIMTFAGSLL